MMQMKKWYYHAESDCYISMNEAEATMAYMSDDFTELGEATTENEDEAIQLHNKLINSQHTK